TRQHYRTIGEIRQQPLRYAAVVVDEVAFRVLLRGPVDLLQVREVDLLLDWGFRWRRRWLVQRGGVDVRALPHDPTLVIIVPPLRSREAGRGKREGAAFDPWLTSTMGKTLTCGVAPTLS